MLRKPPGEGPISFGKRIADLFRMFVLVLAAGISAMLFYMGPASLNALSLALFGYRPIGSAVTAINVLYWAVQIPICFFVLMIVMVLAFWGYRSEGWFVPNMVISIACAGGILFALHWFVLANRMNAWRHLNNWPQQLVLTSFQTCGVEVNELSSKTTAPVGRVRFELWNRSPANVRRAVFTVHVGDRWHHVATDNVAAQEKRLIDKELDFGTIEHELSGDFTGWRESGAEIFWDDVRADAGFAKVMMRRPEAADQPIDDCPRQDISGIWKGDDGTEMQLSQRGVNPRGWVRGGPFAAASVVSGTYDGETFEGTMDRGAGFQLRLAPNGRLEGRWRQTGIPNRSGAWSLRRTGPGPRAPRRH